MRGYSDEESQKQGKELEEVVGVIDAGMKERSDGMEWICGCSLGCEGDTLIQLNWCAGGVDQEVLYLEMAVELQLKIMNELLGFMVQLCK
ncbi:hypothetical protein C5167_050551, partial [Papaver somniferum]